MCRLRCIKEAPSAPGLPMRECENAKYHRLAEVGKTREPPGGLQGLKLLADQPVDRIDPAAAHSNREADDSNQQHIFVSAGAGRITLRQMHEQQGDQYLDGERRREESSEQTNDQADASH